MSSGKRWDDPELSNLVFRVNVNSLNRDRNMKEPSSLEVSSSVRVFQYFFFQLARGIPSGDVQQANENTRLILALFLSHTFETNL